MTEQFYNSTVQRYNNQTFQQIKNSTIQQISSWTLEHLNTWTLKHLNTPRRAVQDRPILLEPSYDPRFPHSAPNFPRHLEKFMGVGARHLRSTAPIGQGASGWKRRKVCQLVGAIGIFEKIHIFHCFDSLGPCSVKIDFLCANAVFWMFLVKNWIFCMKNSFLV